MKAAAESLPVYDRVQFGGVIALATVAGGIVATVVVLSLSPSTLSAVPWLVYGLYGVLALAFALFGQLRVRVDNRTVSAVFGIGLVRKSIALRDIRSCGIVRTRLWWGWGLHWTPAGWLYNVAGRWAVRLDLAAERPVMIGTADPEGLSAAIQARMGPPQDGH